MKCTRKHIVLAVSGVVVALLVGYGVWVGISRLINPYAGLVTSIEVQMTEEVRNLITQRLNTAKASLAAQEQAGEDVDMNLHLTIAESYYMLGDLVSSREEYEIYLELNPISHVAWNAYANILGRMEDYVPAGEAYKKAIEGFKTEEYYRDYAEFLAEHYPERQEEYRRVLDEAFQNLGQTTWTMLALGNWYYAHWDCVQGRAHYSVAQTLSPENDSIALDDNEKYAECIRH